MVGARAMNKAARARDKEAGGRHRISAPQEEQSHQSPRRRIQLGDTINDSRMESLVILGYPDVYAK